MAESDLPQSKLTKENKAIALAKPAMRAFAILRAVNLVVGIAKTLGLLGSATSMRGSSKRIAGRSQSVLIPMSAGLLTAGAVLLAGRAAIPKRKVSVKAARPPELEVVSDVISTPIATIEQHTSPVVVPHPAERLNHSSAKNPVTFKGVSAVAWNAAKAWSDRRASSKGAALALYTLLSLAPILILILAAAGLFVDPASVQTALLAQMKGLMGAAGADAVKTILISAHQNSTGIIASAISAAVLLVSATTAFAELKDSLDELWEVKKSDSSGVWGMLRERVLSVGVLLVLALMLLSSLALSAGIDAVSAMMGDSAATVIGKIGAVLITYFAVTVLFAVIFRFLPAATVSWKDVVIGSALTGALFLIGKVGIGLYLAHGGVSSAYGAAGSVVALVVWIYYSAQIFFYGALFTHGFALRFGSRYGLKTAEASSDGVRSSVVRATPV